MKPDNTRRTFLLSAIMVLVVIISLSTFSCQKKERKTQNLKQEVSKWYQIQGGKFEPIDAPFKAAGVEVKPWTVQSRITDSVVADSKLYLAVNGNGIASMALLSNSLLSNSPPLFRYFYDPVIFKYRTITTLLHLPESILCHLYFNEMLNITTADTLKMEGISLIKLIPQYENYKFIILPFQKKHPDYESVTFLPETNEVYHFEWKYSSEKETKFAYTNYNLANKIETKETRKEFLSEYNFKDEKTSEIPHDLDAVFKASIKALKSLKAADKYTIHFSVKTVDNSIIRRFSYNATNDTGTADNSESAYYNIVTVPTRITKSGIYALLPHNILIYYSQNSAKPVQNVLPVLPSGYRYTGFNCLKDYLVLYWEQSSFIKVGSAGILLWKRED